MFDHLSLDFRDRVSASIKVATRAGTGVRDKPVNIKVSIEVDPRADEAEVTAEATRFGP